MVSRPIQGQAPGFLGLLGVKNLGKLPNDLLDSVQPVVDVEAWYRRGIALLQGRFSQTDVLDYTGFLGPTEDQFGTTIGAIIVPQGFVWYVHEVTAFVTSTGMTMSGDIASAVQMPIGAGLVHNVVGNVTRYNVSLPAPTGNQVMAPSLRDLWCPAGTVMGGFQNGGFADAAMYIGVSVRYSEIPI